MVTMTMTSHSYDDVIISSSSTEEMERPPQFDEASVIKSSTLALIGLIGLVGNVLVLVQIYRRCRPLSSINLLIVHLAVSDLIVTVFCNVTDAIWESTIQW